MRALLCALGVALCVPGVAKAQVLPWPGDAGIEIAAVGDPGGLPAAYEPSGAVWHTRLDALFVVSDRGDVSRLDANGGNVTTWSPGGDLEAVTLIDPATDLLYLGRENPDAILEFDFVTGTLTGEQWDLTPWMNGAANQGLEGLTWVDGLFYASHQGEGNVYVFELSAGGVAQLVNLFPAPGGRTDMAGMHYDADAQVLYGIHDGDNVLVEMERHGALLRETFLPGNTQEGIALLPDCATGLSTVFLSEDAGAVVSYEWFPVTCVDPAVTLSPCGDVNGDLIINVIDAMLTAQFQVGLRVCQSMSRFDLCDITPAPGDGLCNVVDAMRMAQCSVGLVSCNFTCAVLGCP